jgi:hypothetical protein
MRCFFAFGLNPALFVARARKEPRRAAAKRRGTDAAPSFFFVME